jgi:hypothetical protein
MNNLTWVAIVISGVLIAGFGLVSVSPNTAFGASDVQAQDVLFLMSGGLLTSLIGTAGLFGKMGQRASVVKVTK